MVNNESRLSVVTYRDNTLTLAGKHLPIVCPHGLLDEVARKLSTRYKDNLVYSDSVGKDYLISGIFTKVINAIPHMGGVAEVSLTGEGKTTLEMLARDVGLPPIPDEYFVRK